MGKTNGTNSILVCLKKPAESTQINSSCFGLLTQHKNPSQNPFQK